MPPTLPPVDEHGFPIPPTFDGPGAIRRPGHVLGRAWQIGLVLVFVGLMAGFLYKSAFSTGVNQWMANQLAARAQEKYLRGDVPGALADLQMASSWSPDNPNIYALRAQMKLEANDVAGSLKDYDELIRLSPRHAGAYLARAHLKLEMNDVAGSLNDFDQLIHLAPHEPSAYLGRSVAYQRLQRHREAIDDLSKVINMVPGEATPRNNRAYARALAGIDLDAALSDVEQAIGIIDQKIAKAGTNIRDADSRNYEIAQNNAQKAAYLDTRGYIYFLRDNYEPALADLDRAIELSIDWQAIAVPEVNAARRAGVKQRLDRELSVMYHHRGQVLEKLGRADEAKSDLDQGDKLGYNPDAGVF